MGTQCAIRSKWNVGGFFAHTHTHMKWDVDKCCRKCLKSTYTHTERTHIPAKQSTEPMKDQMYFRITDEMAFYMPHTCDSHHHIMLNILYSAPNINTLLPIYIRCKPTRYFPAMYRNWWDDRICYHFVCRQNESEHLFKTLTSNQLFHIFEMSSIFIWNSAFLKFHCWITCGVYSARCIMNHFELWNWCAHQSKQTKKDHYHQVTNRESIANAMDIRTISWSCTHINVGRRQKLFLAMSRACNIRAVGWSRMTTDSIFLSISLSLSLPLSPPVNES